MASVKLQKSIWILSRSTKRYSTGTGKEPAGLWEKRKKDPRILKIR